MKLNVELKASLIAPCGMNCGLCYAFHRDKNKCTGCNSTGLTKPSSCTNCSIKNCSLLKSDYDKYCYSCKKYPCAHLKSLDKRYRLKYGMSMLENLNSIKAVGIRNFLKQEKIKWKCPSCGNILCVHNEVCPVCGCSRSKK
jgi:hypothetical protein